jgi:hypothetical protein
MRTRRGQPKLMIHHLCWGTRRVVSAGVGGVSREVEAAGLWGVVGASPSRSVTGATGVEQPPPESAAPPVCLSATCGAPEGEDRFFALHRRVWPHLTAPPTSTPTTLPAPSGAAGSCAEAHSPRGALGRGPRQPPSLQLQTVGEAFTTPHKPAASTPLDTPPTPALPTPTPTPTDVMDGKAEVGATTPHLYNTLRRRRRRSVARRANRRSEVAGSLRRHRRKPRAHRRRPHSHRRRPHGHSGKPRGHRGRPYGHSGKLFYHRRKHHSHRRKPRGHQGRPHGHSGKPHGHSGKLHVTSWFDGCGGV